MMQVTNLVNSGTVEDCWRDRKSIPIEFKQVEIQIPEIDMKIPKGGRKQRCSLGALLAGASQLIPPAYAAKNHQCSGYAHKHMLPQLPV